MEDKMLGKDHLDPSLPTTLLVMSDRVTLYAVSVDTLVLSMASTKDKKTGLIPTKPLVLHAVMVPFLET